MDRPYFRVLLTPSLCDPILIEGLPGIGNVGRIATNLLMKFYGAKPFAELYAPYFPDYVSVSSDGICRLPKYEFYAASSNEHDLIILTGDTQPSFDDVVAHYEICSAILDFVEKFGCRFIITLGGVASKGEENRIYVAATSPTLATDFMKRGATVYSKGRIVGAAGLLLGLAKERGIDGLCILAATSGFEADRGAGFSVFKFLIKILGDNVKEGLYK
ncbi:MAG: PAC2 family protein [Candidatus Bathyarchaeia archaeon]